MRQTRGCNDADKHAQVVSLLRSLVPQRKEVSKMNIPGFRAEASLKSAIQMTNRSSNDRPNADQADVSGIAPAFWSCLKARMDCAEDPNNLWIPNSLLRCGGFCAYW
jgi:hypothetical protein